MRDDWILPTGFDELHELSSKRSLGLLFVAPSSSRRGLQEWDVYFSPCKLYVHVLLGFHGFTRVMFVCQVQMQPF